MPCYALLRSAPLCYAMLCYAMLCSLALRNIMLSKATLCSATLWLWYWYCRPRQTPLGWGNSSRGETLNIHLSRQCCSLTLAAAHVLEETSSLLLASWALSLVFVALFADFIFILHLCSLASSLSLQIPSICLSTPPKLGCTQISSQKSKVHVFKVRI